MYQKTEFLRRELQKLHAKLLPVITQKMAEFKEKGRNGSELDLFQEVCFCLFTPQTKAEKSWYAVKKLHEKNLLLSGDADEIARTIRGVRFHNVKAKRLVQAREYFFEKNLFSIKEKIKKYPDAEKKREWLVRDINGFGYKEASHFLRNIGHGEQLAILDRHILRSLVHLGFISSQPKTLTSTIYRTLEKQLRQCAVDLSIPLSHLDMVLWFQSTGRIFK